MSSETASDSGGSTGKGEMWVFHGPKGGECAQGMENEQGHLGKARGLSRQVLVGQVKDFGL